MSEVALAALVLGIILLLVYALALYRSGHPTDKTKLKALGLPSGSVRALLAFTIVGGYLVVILFGKAALSTGTGADADTTQYSNVVSGLTGVVGAVVGFYFGGKAGAETPKVDSAEPGNGDGKPEPAGE